MLAALLVAAALAVAGSPAEQRQVLLTIATGSRPQVEQAINKLQFWGNPKGAMATLAKMALGETEGSRPNAAYALSVLHPPEARKVFAALLDDPDAGLRLSGCEGLGRLKPDAGLVTALAAHLDDKVSAVRRECARTVGVWQARGAEKSLLAAYRAETDPDVRLVQVDALGHAGTKATAEALAALPPTASPELRVAATRALAFLGTPDGEKAVQAWVQSAAPEDRMQAVDLLSEITAAWTTEPLVTLLADPVSLISLKAARTLIARKDKRGVISLVVRAEKASGDDKIAYEGALEELHITQAQRLDILSAAGQVK